MSIITFIIVCLLAGLFNRLGGIGLKIPLASKIRDWGVPACGVWYLMATLIKISVFYYWALIGFFVLSWGALSTYWDYWSNDDVQWFEWALHGFMLGLAALPIAIYTGRFFGFTIRALILTAFMPFSNKLQFKLKWDKTDGVEFSRGTVFCVTLPLLVV